MVCIRVSPRKHERAPDRRGRPFPVSASRGSSISRQGLRIPPTGFADYQVTSPPAVIGDTIVVGSAIADGTDKPPPSGEVRGFDAMTGRLRWTWDPVPQAPTAVGADTWKGDSRRSAGGANAWSVIVADPARNPVFVPTGSSIALGGPIVTAGGLVFAAGTLDGAIMLSTSPAANSSGEARCRPAPARLP